MKLGSLFSGIGGFELAAEKVGWKTIFTCEIDAFCRRILAYYWPSAIHYNDIKELTAKKYYGQIDILTGGFPCQPFSVAGKRKGTKDNRYLWPEMLRIIREARPRWVVAENVYGLVNWDEGLVFETVQADLEREGYQVQSFILPAAGVNAPHQRYRVWIIAYTYGNGLHRSDREDEKQRSEAREHAQRYFDQMGIDAYSHGKRLERRTIPDTPPIKKKRLKRIAGLLLRKSWNEWPVESPLFGMDDGLPKELDGITLPKWRRESIRGYGNAIVPQVALQIFRTIEKIEKARQS